MDARRVCAGIVTFNPELGRLRENLSAISPQVSRLFVFDNGSDDSSAVRALVQEFPCARFLPFPENRGIAVALNALARAAKEDGASEVLFLDQDSVSTPGMVAGLQEAAGLVRASGARLGVVGPTVHDRNLGFSNAHVEGEALVQDRRDVLTSGSLVSLQAWEAVGGYDERLFLDWVDIGFCYALRRAGFVVAITSLATIDHEIGKRSVNVLFPAWVPVHVPFTFRDPEGRQALFSENYPASRWEDKVRSQTILQDEFKGTDDGRFLDFSLLCTFFRGTALEPHGLENLRAMMRGRKEGKAMLGKERGR
ncbi:glycosyltransferase [Olsenella sp. YH-ols2217]|uniref:Glycosyltransferase n=2 Tax=Kribbibacterium absianum TaxID=3044210 RepID=A0ABT6ZM87_9ACTN|nr:MULTISPECIES: glycosyltransferase [unclassified Olsenella]MDJ1122161.1 glycosyltransferase [Olsenella sp. YH-ols2216]MDJ1130169.1 glycosyltransferase [Olsenella sp. YH-ols2217]